MFPGRIVANKYRVLGVIGRGGMGVVCEAERIDTGEHVALKFLRDDIESDLQPAERFAREARLATRLDNPHACKLLGVDEWELGPFIVMELLDGRPLNAVLPQGEPLPWRQAVRIAHEACLALGEAHRIGIVHRDIKPGNVFLAWSAQQRATTKILDFGVAKIPANVITLGAGPSLTDAALLLGTPAYVAPEQLTNSKLVDARADVWAMGVVLYEMLAGRLPFYSPLVPKLLVMIAKDEPPPLSTLMPDTPSGLCELVHRCLLKSPVLRFNDAHELATALAAYECDDAALLNPLLEAASLHPLRLLSSHPPKASPADEAPLGAAPTARHSRTDSLGPHTTARGRRSLPQSSAPHLVVAAGIGIAALIGVAGYHYAIPKVVGAVLPQSPVASSRSKVQTSVTTLEAGPSAAAAQLTLDGIPLSTNPFVVARDDDGKEHILRATAEGFGTREHRFRFGSSPLIQLTLEQLVADAKAEKAAAPTSPKPRLSSPTLPVATVASQSVHSLDQANPY